MKSKTACVIGSLLLLAFATIYFLLKIDHSVSIALEQNNKRDTVALIEKEIEKAKEGGISRDAALKIFEADLELIKANAEMLESHKQLVSSVLMMVIVLLLTHVVSLLYYASHKKS